MVHFDLFKSTLRQSNQSIKKATIYFLKPMLYATSSCTSPPQGPPSFRIQLGPLGGDHIAGDGKDPLRFR